MSNFDQVNEIMVKPISTHDEFVDKLSKIVVDNISNEQFGVAELAAEIGMSRSNLLRKLKKMKNQSVSQFIRQLRIEYAMGLISEESLSITEVSYQVGFSSTSYFIKCFRDHYGYPPGEALKHQGLDATKEEGAKTNKRKTIRIVISTTMLVIITLLIFGILKPFSDNQANLEKSIAVLPFIDDSNDSSNIHIINGLMEAVLGNLQKIEELRVTSRTSVEKYRNKPTTSSEIAKELDVSYFVEGSGQKIGDKILLHIQLIEAKTDKHLWAEQYKRKVSDIFELQQEVAKDIAKKVQVVITPEENARIEKIPTDNIEAYELLLKGLEAMFKGGDENLHQAIELFEKAIELDGEFARAYADLSMSYFFLDANQTEKKYSNLINENADKALLYDPELAQSLISKALYYINLQDYHSAESYLERALEYNPNSAIVINTLSDFYTRYIPNTEKYLEYALKGIKIDIASHDSTETSYIYLHLSNALIQSGFIEQAKKYIEKSLNYDRANLYSQYVKAFIQYSDDSNLETLRQKLITVFKKDTSRLDVVQEVAKIHYYQRNFEGALPYYQALVDVREAYNLKIYPSEDAKIAVTLNETGNLEQSKEIFSKYLHYAENDESIYTHLSQAVYYAYTGNLERALLEFDLFSNEDNYHYWTIIFLKIDPLIDSLKDDPEYIRIMTKIETKFWNKHQAIKARLEKEGLL